MPVTLLEKLLLTRLKVKNKYKVCAGLSEILAKTYRLPVVAIYAGAENLHRLMGAYIDQEDFGKSNPIHHLARDKSDPDQMEGFNLPLLLPVLSSETDLQDVKLHSQLFGVCYFSFERWKIAVAFGGVDSVTRKRVGLELKEEMALLSTLLLPLLILEKEGKEDDIGYQEEISLKFIQSLMDLRGFVTVILRLILIYFNGEYATISLKHQKKHIFIEIGDRQNKDFIREFDFLQVGSSKNIFTTPQTYVVIKVTLFYLNQIIHRFFKPRLDPQFYLENIKDLVRIYEALFQSISNELDINLGTADFIASKIDLSEKEQTLLHWMIGTYDLGKIVLRVFSVSYDKNYEHEVHSKIRDCILKNMSQLIEDYDILSSDFSLFQGIIKTCHFYFNFINHGGQYEISNLQQQLNQTQIPENFKRMLLDRIKLSNDKQCFDVRCCPYAVQEMCSCSQSKQHCFQQESVFCAHFQLRCQECLYYHIQQESKL